MNCRDIEKQLAEGKPLTVEAEDHVRNCAGCGALLEVLSQPQPSFNPQRTQATLQGLVSQLSPVTPLPSDPALITIALGIFVAFTLIVGGIVGMPGYSLMTTLERTVYCGAILCFGLLFSIASVKMAIPGSKLTIHGGRVALGSVVAMAWIVSALFRTFALDHFIRRGFPCLRFGCVCAALFGALAALVLRRGYVTNVGATALLIGSFAGFSGVAVLSLHCTLQVASHIIVWHLGTVAVSALAGVAVGSFLQRRA